MFGRILSTPKYQSLNSRWLYPCLNWRYSFSDSWDTWLKLNNLQERFIPLPTTTIPAGTSDQALSTWIAKPQLLLVNSERLNYSHLTAKCWFHIFDKQQLLLRFPFRWFCRHLKVIGAEKKSSLIVLAKNCAILNPFTSGPLQVKFSKIKMCRVFLFNLQTCCYIFKTKTTVFKIK